MKTHEQKVYLGFEFEDVHLRVYCIIMSSKGELCLILSCFIVSSQVTNAWCCSQQE